MNRRELFKTTLKRTLPFLGVIVCTPSLLSSCHDEELLGCNNSCVGSAQAGCGTSCSASCVGTSENGW